MKRMANVRWANFLLVFAVVWSVGIALAMASPAWFGGTAKAGSTMTAKNPCNPCAAKNPCNPCAAKNPCNPCNPCAAKNPCNPYNPCKAKKKW